MNTFEFILEQKNVYWDTVYVEVEAETQEEAIEKCKDGLYTIVDYGDSEFDGTEDEIIMDEHRNVL